MREIFLFSIGRAQNKRVKSSLTIKRAKLFLPFKIPRRKAFWGQKIKQVKKSCQDKIK